MIKKKNDHQDKSTKNHQYKYIYRSQLFTVFKARPYLTASRPQRRKNWSSRTVCIAAATSFPPAKCASLTKMPSWEYIYLYTHHWTAAAAAAAAYTQSKNCKSFGVTLLYTLALQTAGKKSERNIQLYVREPRHFELWWCARDTDALVRVYIILGVYIIAIRRSVDDGLV